MSTATTTETAGKPFAGGTASVLELRDDGTGNSKHLVKKAKERAKECPYRGDQLGGVNNGSEVLKQRLAGLGPGGFMRPACQRARWRCCTHRVGTTRVLYPRWLQKTYHAAGGGCRNRACQVRS
jgi:hypothetical protein